jgi:uncharacterized membrane protein
MAMYVFTSVLSNLNSFQYYEPQYRSWWAITLYVIVGLVFIGILVAVVMSIVTGACVEWCRCRRHRDDEYEEVMVSYSQPTVVIPTY